ncbi:MAG TPA: hypothetical protein VII90_07765 [Anaerolineales bacterium]
MRRCGHRSAKDAPGRIGDDVVEASIALVGNFLHDGSQLTAVPNRHRTAGHEQEQRTVGLDRETSDGFAAVTLFRSMARREIPEQVATGDVGPIETSLQRMPERILTGVALTIDEQFRLRHRFLFSGGVLLFPKISSQTPANDNPAP